MGTLEEIKRLQKEGKDEQEIIQSLRSRGVSTDDIASALTQSRIREAVDSPQTSDEVPVDESMPGMQASIMGTESFEKESQPASDFAPQPEGEQEYPPQYDVPSPDQSEQNYSQDQSQQSYSPDYGNQQQQAYPQYQPTGLSAETITEIAEQVIHEKLNETRDKLQQSITFKKNAETRLDLLDQRLQRIEKIIDRLQLSILQKVGEFGTSMGDIKKELIETQKSFKSMVGSHHHSQK